MRVPVIGCCIMGCIAAVTALAARQLATVSDDAAVRRVVADYMGARALEEPAAIGNLFTDDADQYTTSGQWRRGRAAIVEGTLDASRRNPGDRAIRVEAVRFLTPDVAIVDGPYEIADRRIWTTIVVIRQAAGWRIGAIRNIEPGTPIAASPPGGR